MPKLRKEFLLIAQTDHDLYNAYQQTQNPRVEKAMLGAKFVASFIGHEAGKALFIGLYEITGHKQMSFKQFWSVPSHLVLRDTYGMHGMTDKRGTTLWFDLERLPFAKERTGKMVIEWPGNDRAYHRWAHANTFPILQDGLSGQDSLIEDINDIQDSGRDSTTKEALVLARRGQGMFRTQVLQRWGNACAVTGATTVDAIRASHIRPWRHSSDSERLDPSNGLPLVASLDALFDGGLISFDGSGKLIASDCLSDSERRIFGINGRALLRKPTARTAKYLEYHRHNRFQK
jgi:hypothetical protein